MTVIENLIEDLRNFSPEEIEAIAKDIHEKAKARQTKNIELFEEAENQIAIERDKEMDAGVDEGTTFENSMKLVRKVFNESHLTVS